MKRKSLYDINESNCEEDPIHDAPDLGKVSTPEEIAQRRILKIKGHKAEESSAPAKLVLLEKLSESESAKEGDKKEEEQAKSIETAGKEEQKQSLAFSTKSSLFGNSLTQNKEAEAKEATTATPTTTSSNAAPAKEAPTGGLFGNLPQNGSLFGSSQSKSLFGNSTGTGLFANIGSTANNGSGATTTTGGLFGSGLFTNTTGNNSGLFSGLSKPAEGASLFGQPIQQSGLFGINNTSQVVASGDSKIGKAGSDDEGGEGEEDDEQEHSPEIDESKAQKYQYANPFEKIVNKQVVKVRKGTNDILEKGFLSLEKNTQDSAAPNIFVYRDQIKKVIFTYNVTRKITKIEKINNSAKNLKVTLYRKGDTGLVTDIIKAQFNDEKEGEEFFEKMKVAIEA